MKKTTLIELIHLTQDNIAMCGIKTHSSDWVIGLLSQIATDVATLELDGDETNINKTGNDRQGI